MDDIASLNAKVASTAPVARTAADGAAVDGSLTKEDRRAPSLTDRLPDLLESAALLRFSHTH
ncbi:MAG: hypothetical protein U0531_06155 [Dehalococcoidia bacterium]